MTAIYQISPVICLIFDRIFKSKHATQKQIVGSLLVLLGVAGFAIVKFKTQNDDDDDKHTTILGIILAIIATLIFTIYDYRFEDAFENYDTSILMIIQNMGIYLFIISSITFCIVQLTKYETVKDLSLKSRLIIIGDGFVGALGEYLVVYSVSNADAFIFSMILSFQAPLGYIAQIIDDHIHKKKVKISVWFIPLLIVIVFGCVIVSWDETSEDNASKENEPKNSIELTDNVASRL